MALPGRLQFEVSIHFDYDSGRMIVAPRGELDLLTADDFAKALDSATEGRDTLVLDLADLDFCDVVGLGVLAGAARRLAERGGGLVLRSPPATITKMLEVTGLRPIIRIEDVTSQSPAAAVSDADQLAHTIAENLAPFVEDALVDATMQMVASLAKAIGSAIETASVTLRRRGRYVTVAASDSLADQLDQVQYDAESGPCIEASSLGHAVHRYPMSEAEEWPALSRAAQGAGIQSVLSKPFVGHPAALNLYGSTDLGAADDELASLLIGEASRVLTLKTVEREDLRLRVSQGLVDRDRIARAQGVMMERHSLTAAEAHTAAPPRRSR